MANPKFSNPPLPLPVAGARGANPGQANAPLVALSNPGDSWVWDFGNLAAYNQAVKKTKKRAATDAWMLSERHWKNKELWDTGHTRPDRDSKIVKDIAVKQSLRFAFPLGGYGLEFEATNLSELGKAKSQHIVRMYRHLYEEVGQRTNPFDVGLVHRIFLEYCPGGDAGNWIRAHLNNNTTIPEYELWTIFHCLARACLVMHHRSDDATIPSPGWPRQELVHFDLKLENVLVGAPTTDVEHRDMSPFKFGDLGNGRRVPAFQSPRYLSDYSEFGTPEYYAPEQVTRKDHLSGPRPWFDFVGNCTVVGVGYRTPTKIWQIALIMHCLVSRSRYPIWEKNSIDRLRCYKSILSARLRGRGDTVGNSTDQACEYNPSMSAYSVELRTLVHECLIINPRQRPLPAEVVQRTQQAIDLTRQNNRNIAAKPPTLTPAQIAAADKLHDAKIALENVKLKQGNSQARISNSPPPPQNQPVTPNLPTPIPTPKPTPKPTTTLTPSPPVVTPVAASLPATTGSGSGSGTALQPAINQPLAEPAHLVRPAPLRAGPPAMAVPEAPEAMASVLHKVTQVTCIVQ
ncbi:kinase-like domain-containing protein [Rhexocercosporidium sp. MPI-PUGE-AT-0058]|nr:kinase-like domain-containing protein [Rhexocercosporidium sp. MPI-PUGE-AT-0058]